MLSGSVANTSLAQDMTRVCPGERLTLVCQTDQDLDQILSWNVFIPHYNRSYSKLYAYTGVRDPLSVEIDSMVTLSFDRISESGVHQQCS